MTSHEKVGRFIAVAGALAAAAGFATGVVSVQVGCGIAVSCILIGVGIAKGKFSSANSASK